MHNNGYHRAVAGGGGGGGRGRHGGPILGALELVALAIVFIVGVSFGMYLEGHQHHEELQSFASPRVSAWVRHLPMR